MSPPHTQSMRAGGAARSARRRRKVISHRDQFPYRARPGRCHGGTMTVLTAGTIPISELASCPSSGFSVRPIVATDAAALLRFHARLSHRSVHLRYFYPHRELGPDEVTHLTCVDGFNRAAYVVEHEGEIIAVGPL